jgi:hypothetical protein
MSLLLIVAACCFCASTLSGVAMASNSSMIIVILPVRCFMRFILLSVDDEAQNSDTGNGCPLIKAINRH